MTLQEILGGVCFLVAILIIMGGLDNLYGSTHNHAIMFVLMMIFIVSGFVLLYKDNATIVTITCPETR